MPAKKSNCESSPAFSPVHIDFTFLPQGDGSIIVAYQTNDPRGEATADTIIDAIATDNDFAIDEIFFSAAEVIH